MIKIKNIQILLLLCASLAGTFNISSADQPSPVQNVNEVTIGEMLTSLNKSFALLPVIIRNKTNYNMQLTIKDFTTVVTAADFSPLGKAIDITPIAYGPYGMVMGNIPYQSGLINLADKVSELYKKINSIIQEQQEKDLTKLLENHVILVTIEPARFGLTNIVQVDVVNLNVALSDILSKLSETDFSFKSGFTDEDRAFNAKRRENLFPQIAQRGRQDKSWAALVEKVLNWTWISTKEAEYVLGLPGGFVKPYPSSPNDQKIRQAQVDKVYDNLINTWQSVLKNSPEDATILRKNIDLIMNRITLARNHILPKL